MLKLYIHTLICLCNISHIKVMVLTKIYALSKFIIVCYNRQCNINIHICNNIILIIYLLLYDINNKCIFVNI